MTANLSDRPQTTPTGAPHPVALHVRVWNPGAARRVLVVHGLGSDGTTAWRIAEEVAALGATAVVPDLRNHGLSPTTLDHRIEAYAADLADLADGWDLVVGHSLGGAALAMLCARPGFAGRGLLIDPVLHLRDEDREPLREALVAEVGGVLTHEGLAASQPGWSAEDRHRKVLASALASRRTMELTLDHNQPWDVRASVRLWSCPVHLLASDPAVGTLLAPADAQAAADAHPGVQLTTVLGAGHSIHRDDPQAVIDALHAALGDG